MIKVVHMGIGPLGQKIAGYMLERGGLKIVAAVDPDPEKTGRDLGDVCGFKKKLNITVFPDLKTALKGRTADVAVITTVSSVAKLEAQVSEAAKAGLSIVSTCEELSFPFLKAASVAKRIDAICKKHKVACVGTGVNPGFLMDYLPSVLTSVCQRVDSVTVTRVQDASSRRIPFQRKIGAGLTRAQFRAKVAEGSLRHVGLLESMDMIAASLNLKLDRQTESLKPVIAGKVITSGHCRIEKGMACGVEQIGLGYIGKKLVLKLHFRAAVGEGASFDTVEIKGNPDITCTIPGGVNGDVATSAITVNAIRSVADAKSGLRSMLDIPVPGCFGSV